MIQTRVIPVLLLKNQGLYKGIKFKKYRYIGDPINTVKLFNDKEVDELVVLDIESSIRGQAPDLEFLQDIVSEAFMPVGYGGGVDSVETAKAVFRIGVEKIIINSAAYRADNLISEISSIFGSQSVVVSIDVRKSLFKKYQLYSYSGTKKEKIPLAEHLQKVEKNGAGEVIISNIDCDGSLQGYDLDLLKLVSDNLDIPVIASCGAGEVTDFELAKNAGAAAVAAGSMFVFRGNQRGILINYPKESELRERLHR